MKKIYVFLIVLISLILSIYLFLLFYEYRSQQEQVFYNYTLSQNEMSLLKDGDIILRHGYGFVSDMIVKTLNDSTGISHCAILTKYKGHWIIIHSVSSTLSDVDGVQWQDLRTFINQSKKKSIVVVRYKHAKDDFDLALIGSGAKYYLQKKIPFDNAFDLKDSSSIYCSELLWKVFKNEYNVDIFESKYRPEHYDYMKFDTFLDTSNFEIIIDHRNK
ncbi:MAG: hypothetical protein HGB12_03650 [Bacteroidetes bacterium]|nr:hypothetical protein [Bacteroidota bacterium]